MGSAANIDLAAAALVAVLAAASVATGAPLWVRLPLGLAATLIAPGYALSMVALPRGRLDPVERSALAFSLSIGAVVLAAPLINVLPGGLTQSSVVTSLATLTLGAAFLAWIRRAPSRTNGDTRTSELNMGTTRTAVGWRLAASGLVLVAIGVASFAIGGSNGVASTEFFLVNGGPQPAGSEAAPAPVPAGRTVEFALGLTNVGPAARFQVQVLGPGGVLADLKPFDVAAGVTWTGRVAFAIDVPGDNVQVDIVLLRPPDSTPYRSLRLYLDVIAQN